MNYKFTEEKKKYKMKQIKKYFRWIKIFYLILEKKALDNNKN
jgi:hypothetical protein